jgi:hypothetical protein
MLPETCICDKPLFARDKFGRRHLKRGRCAACLQTRFTQTQQPATRSKQLHLTATVAHHYIHISSLVSPGSRKRYSSPKYIQYLANASGSVSLRIKRVLACGPMASTTAPNVMATGTTSPHVELNSDASPAVREESRDKENQFFQTLADRIKARSRRSLPVNIAPVTTEMKPRRLPWPTTPLEPQSHKRPSDDKAGGRPTRRQKVFRDQDTAVRVVPKPRVTTSLTDNNFRQVETEATSSVLRRPSE